MTTSDIQRSDIERQVDAEDRDSMPTVADYLRADSHPVPDVLFERSTSEDLPVTPVPKEVFTSREYAEREQRLLWNRVWQMACREAEVGRPGDFFEYEIGDQSVVVARQPDGTVRAFHNVCQHRGTRLVEGSGHADAFTCSFHGWAYNTDGTLRSVPCRWDFPQVSDTSHALPEVSCDTWNGFVFINLDPDAEPLADYLGDTLPRHFQEWPLARRFKAVHVKKVVPCNWKIALQAFLEVYHTVRTHPDILAYAADANAQYDQYHRHARFITMMGTPSPHLGELAEQEVLEAMVRGGLLEVHDSGTGDHGGAALTVPEGKTARHVLADWMRTSLPTRTGADYSHASDCELIDVIQYFCFPNLIPWGGHSFPLVYRALPGPDPDTATWEVMIFSDYPAGTDQPPDTPCKLTPPDEPWSELPELGGVGPILDEDMRNMRRLQLGLKSAGLKEITFARYQEATLRRYHDTLESYTGPVDRTAL